ncbi:MAG: glycosyltransferase [Terriglobales bacterium]
MHTILHTIETGGPGGAETIFLNLATGLDPVRFRSIAFLRHDGWLHSQLRERGVPTVLVSTPNPFDLRPLRAMARLVRDQGVDLIHSHLPDQNFDSCLVGCLTKRPTVVTYHGQVKLTGAKQKLKLGVVRRYASAVAVVSRHLQASFLAADFAADKLICIYNGIDVDRFRDPAPSNLRAALGCGPRTRLVGMVANLRESKGYEHFVRAARSIADRMQETCFVAIGDMDARIREQLAALVRNLELEGRFFFLGFRSDVPALLHDLDVFVLSSENEGFSLATVEAMAAEKVVVVTRSGGPEEIVDDERTGFLVPVSEPDRLAERVCDVLLHPQQAAAMGKAAREKAARCFSLRRMIEEYQRLYERCLSRGPA